MGFADITLICYALGSLGGILGLVPLWRALRKPAAWLIAAGFAAHTVLIVQSFLFRDIAEFSRGQLVQVMAWSLVLVYCVTWWRLRFSILGLTAGPLALALFFFSTVSGGIEGSLPTSMTGAFFVLHLVVLSLSFGLVTLGMGSSLYFLNLHRKLKSKKIPAAADANTPALATVDRINRLVVLWGFLFFTIGLTAGFAWAWMERGATVSADPKEVASILLWLLFALVFMQRFVLGWQGGKAARMLIILFVAILGSGIVVNFFLSSHHNFFQPLLF